MSGIEGDRPATLADSVQRVLRSSSGEAFRISVGYPLGLPPSAGYPLVIVLDANILFGTALEALRLMSFAEQASPAMLLGIGYPEDDPGSIQRRRLGDFTWPTPEGAIDPYHRSLGARIGGAPDFLRFVLDEACAEAAQHVPIDPGNRSIIGYSFGGGFVLGAAFADPGLFQGVASISPTLWWNDAAVPKQVPSYVQRLAALPGRRRLMLAVGALEDEPQRAPADWDDEASNALHAVARTVERTRDLASRIAVDTTGHLDLSFRVFEGETHASVAPIAISHALRFLLPPSVHD